MNLDTLKTEIESHLESQGFSTFYGYSRVLDTMPIVYWDTESYPDYQLFLRAAKAAGIQLIVFHQREFSSNQVDDAIDQLDGAEMPRDEHRAMERRLNELRMYDGFTCALELSFDHQGRVFLFDLRTDWYNELSEILNDIDVIDGGAGEEDDNPMGGYFSKN